MSPATDRLTFLGTAGARLMVASQILASGGLWLELAGTQILLDPGPGTLVQAARRKLRASKLDAIVLSHRHLDHSADVNVMIEAMTDGGLRRRGTLFAPRDALEDDPVILHYLRSYLDNIEILEEGKSYNIGEVTLKTPIRHRHAGETYGVIFASPRHTISCIVDTRFFPELCSHYQGDLVIVNVVRLEPGHPFDHLSAPEAGEIIKEIKPKVAILTHFGMTMWRAKPWEVARRLSEETGVRVIAARDGMKFDLAELD
ncbi:MAG: MBL fold metallo-hydrolase [Dehalococcoidia bacterium]|jgi:phosphoribosyl 1,2-cyclic phosphodiesterase|nr:MBL fold metallo-hydrolase [Chloroflexota bacterium]MCK4242423.1 MBL fold metallo-hydrolase [Dehalococcoidia bacterium]